MSRNGVIRCGSALCCVAPRCFASAVRPMANAAPLSISDFAALQLSRQLQARIIRPMVAVSESYAQSPNTTHQLLPGWKFWVPASSINFYCIPLDKQGAAGGSERTPCRVLYLALWCFVWSLLQLWIPWAKQGGVICIRCCPACLSAPLQLHPVARKPTLCNPPPCHCCCTPAGPAPPLHNPPSQSHLLCPCPFPFRARFSVLYMSCCSVLWTAYLSYASTTAVGKDRAKEAAKPKCCGGGAKK